jgi:hypothetical protein
LVRHVATGANLRLKGVLELKIEGVRSFGV